MNLRVLFCVASQICEEIVTLCFDPMDINGAAYHSAECSLRSEWVKGPAYGHCVQRYFKLFMAASRSPSLITASVSFGDKQTHRMTSFGSSSVFQ